MEESLHHVLEQLRGAERHDHGLHGLHACVDHVRALFEQVGPHEVQQVEQRILTAQTDRAEGDVLHRGTRCLAMHHVSVHQRVLQQRRDGVDIVLAHFADVFEHETQGLQHTVLHVQVGNPVLVHQGGQHRERRACLSHNGDGDGRADAHLALLYLQVVEQRVQHILRTNGLGDVAKGIHRSSADGFLVCLEQLKQLETDAHPLTGRHLLCAAVCNSAHKVNAVLLHFLVSVLEDGGKSGQ
mmetsp:Transcript_21899/g.37842  ORF Transcript_21899/g.37842 Transcript_21899/m.37842 type:complete len:241 (-) Transcript_21899:503-1225(-)